MLGLKGWIEAPPPPPRPPAKEEVYTLAGGGKQTKEKDEFRYFSPAWLIELAQGLTAGAEKYGPDNWRSIPATEHAWRAIRHLVKFAAGDRSEEHLINASMRCMMAFEVAKKEAATHG